MRWENLALQSNLIQKRKELRFYIVAMIVAKSMFIQVVLQILRAKMVMNATNTIFEVAPKAFGSIGVNIAHYINFMRMKNFMMPITSLGQSIVRRPFVCIDGRPNFYRFSTIGCNVTFLALGIICV